jgi:hypothetical protein
MRAIPPTSIGLRREIIYQFLDGGDSSHLKGTASAPQRGYPPAAGPEQRQALFEPPRPRRRVWPAPGPKPWWVSEEPSLELFGTFWLKLKSTEKKAAFRCQAGHSFSNRKEPASTPQRGYPPAAGPEQRQALFEPPLWRRRVWLFFSYFLNAKSRQKRLPA